MGRSWVTHPATVLTVCYAGMIEPETIMYMSQQATGRILFLLRKTGGVRVRDKETSFLLCTRLGSFLKYMHTGPLNKNSKNKNTIKRGINSLYGSDILNKPESFHKIYFIWAIPKSDNKHSRYSNIYSCICILWPL